MSDQKQELTSWIVSQVSQLLMISEEDISTQANFFELGLDSQDHMAIIADLNEKLGTQFKTKVVDEHGTIEKLVAYVVENANEAQAV
ncbi:acyl carrier protein [Saccharophagus degradans]|uniref:acyl carrier protein n=1 Tax=Saccharophagus degradans TaxID=86304 RepID=UPI0024780599|nr:acyl carrier protein [Saccharophagus degradans]WGP00073.1 acyl carrier protein [Saccharophagus degradans]